MVLHLHVQLHHLVDVEGLDAAGDHHAQRVADEVAGVVILQERGKFGEELALLRHFDVLLDGEIAFAPRLGEHAEHHAQRLEIAVLAVARGAEDGADAGGDAFEDVHRVGDEQGAERGAADDEQLRRLHQHQQVALFHKVATQYRAEDDKDSEDGKHARDTPLEGMGGGEAPPGCLSAEALESMRGQERLAEVTASAPRCCLAVYSRSSRDMSARVWYSPSSRIASRITPS